MGTALVSPPEVGTGKGMTFRSGSSCGGRGGCDLGGRRASGDASMRLCDKNKGRLGGGFIVPALSPKPHCVGQQLSCPPGGPHPAAAAVGM